MSEGLQSDMELEKKPPWKVQRLLKNSEIPTQSEVFRVAQTYEIPQEKVLYLLTYLTGGRISEVIDIRAEDFENIQKGDRLFVIIHMNNKKNKRKNRKTIPIPLDKEGFLINYILQYIDGRHGRLFRFKTVRRAHQIISKSKTNPHWIRHIRLTHLVTLYNLSDYLVQRYAGWTDTKPAKYYMELRWVDIADRM